MFRLRTLLSVSSLVQVLGVTLLLVALAVQGGQAAVEPLVQRLVVEIDASVHDEMTGLIAEAHQANAVQRLALTQGHIDLHDEAAWQRHLWQAKDVFPSVSYLTVADDRGQWFGLQVFGDMRWSRTADGGYDSHEVGPDGEVGERVARIASYDSFDKDWYQLPLQRKEPVWSPIYVWGAPKVLSMTLSEPVLDASGEVTAVLGIDLALGDIHRFLQRIDIGPHGRVFLVERSGELVAASAEPDPFVTPGPDQPPERLAATDYADEVVAATAAALPPLRSIDTPRDLRIDGPTGGLRVRAAPVRADGLDWVLVVAVAERDVLAEVWASAWRTLWAGLAFVALAVFGGFVVARWVSRPLAELSHEVQLVREFKLDNAFDVDTRLVEIQRLTDSLHTMQTGLHSFQRFVPADLVRRILAMGEEATLGGEAREVTVLFSDLRGYSTLIETLSPGEVIEFMNAYFEGMEEVIDAHDGVVLELLGDAILAVFGAPDAVPDHAGQAARCAVAMRARLEALNTDLPVQLGHRIGVHTGEVVAGNIGGHSYMKYGIIGDVVNVAARLEQLNKQLGTSILVSAEVIAHAPTLRDGATDHGEVALKGRDQPQHVFAL